MRREYLSVCIGWLCVCSVLARRVEQKMSIDLCNCVRGIELATAEAVAAIAWDKSVLGSEASVCTETGSCGVTGLGAGGGSGKSLTGGSSK